MLPQWVIEKKRDGHALSEEEIRFFIQGYTTGDIPDYQMAALAMAIYLQGMTFEETAALTDTMLHSGDVVVTSSLSRYRVDKHSTGGIGDKVSLVLAPLVACCELAVPMISGRGLGITGGTLDKLESIRGYRTDLSEEEFVRVVQECGCAITGQTGRLAPADKKLYGLRDVTGTVPSIPLITASIMCKKLAEGIDGLVLDVKWGAGAFMKTVEDAHALAETMVEVGRRMQKDMAALITDMNEPLGKTAGNALEVNEAIAALRGDGPTDLMDVTLALCAQMLLLGEKAANEQEADTLLREKLASGEALNTFRSMVAAQGGDVSMVDDPSRLPQAAHREELTATGQGYVAEMNAEAVGRACLLLGAGRSRTDDPIDPAVGVSDLAKIGDAVDQGQPLAVMHVNDRSRFDEARRLLESAFTITEKRVAPIQRVHQVISPNRTAT